MMAVPPLFFAVFWLFAVFIAMIATFANGHYAESLSEVEDTRTGNVCQLIIAFVARPRHRFAVAELSCISVDPLH
jgi:hypothetical protein